MTRRFGLVALLLLTTGCQQEMAHQPSYRPLTPSEQFENGRSARPLEPGVVPRGYLRSDSDLYRGVPPTSLKPELAAVLGPAWALVSPPYTTVFPFKLTEAGMQRGRAQFNIYCSVCHDRIGTGHGRIPQRGYLGPPSLHSRRLRAAPEGYLFEVISEGLGGMPAYGDQVTPQDRWLIIAYIRALQLSQDARLDDVTDKAERERLMKEVAP
jgi:mono/diheme cytochrome c family protein